MVYCSECGAKLSTEHIAYTEYADHTDADSDGKCDNCGAAMPTVVDADAEAAAAVDALIAEIGTVEYTDASKAKIDAARVAYDALTDAQKELVESLETLTAAESQYAELKEAAEKPSTPDKQDDEPDNGTSGKKSNFFADLWAKIKAFFQRIGDFFKNIFKK